MGVYVLLGVYMSEYLGILWMCLCVCEYLCVYVWGISGYICVYMYVVGHGVVPVCVCTCVCFCGGGVDGSVCVCVFCEVSMCGWSYVCLDV